MTTAEGNEPGRADRPAAPLDGPSSWQLDPAGSTVRFTHKAMWGLATVRGSFGQVAGSGEILADGSGRGRLEIAAATLDTKNHTRDEHLRSADFFNAAEHPQVVIDITRATSAGSDTVRATGTLTAAGITRPLEVTAKLTEATEQAVTLTADLVVDRADFGMTWNRLGTVSGKAHVGVVARFVR